MSKETRNTLLGFFLPILSIFFLTYAMQQYDLLQFGSGYGYIGHFLFAAILVGGVRRLVKDREVTAVILSVLMLGVCHPVNLQVPEVMVGEYAFIFVIAWLGLNGVLGFILGSAMTYKPTE